MDPVATTVVTAKFFLVAPHVKTDHNVTNNWACQQLNPEQRSTAQAIFNKKHSTIITKKIMNRKMSDEHGIQNTIP